MNRRELLGGAAAAGTVAGIANATPMQIQPASPDAHLIAMAAHYPAALDAFNAYRGPDDSPEENRLRADMLDTWRVCMVAQPRTLEGLAAKARLVLVEAADIHGDEQEADQTEDKMARAVVHDLLRLAGVS